MIPLGTGNDLCRGLSIPLDPLESVKVIQKRQTRLIDVGEISYGGDKRFFVNGSGIGFSGEVDRKLENINKSLWGPLGYLKSGLDALRDMQPFNVEVSSLERKFCSKALNIVVSNGSTAAGGIPVAPQAKPDDGLFDVIFYLGEKFSDQLFNLKDIYAGDHLECENVTWFRTAALALKTDPAVYLNLDGELIDKKLDSFSYRILPKALRVFVP